MRIEANLNLHVRTAAVNIKINEVGCAQFYSRTLVITIDVMGSEVWRRGMKEEKAI